MKEFLDIGENYIISEVHILLPVGCILFPECIPPSEIFFCRGSGSHSLLTFSKSPLPSFEFITARNLFNFQERD